MGKIAKLKSFMLSIRFLLLPYLSQTSARCSCPLLCTRPYPDLMMSLVESCSWQSVVVLSDENPLTNYVVKVLSSSGSLFGHVDISSFNQSELESQIGTLYKNDLMKFLVVVHRPGDVIAAAESIFQTGSRRGFAAMPHKSHWLILTWTFPQKYILIKKLNSSSFDNVALVMVKPESQNYPNLVLQPAKMLTLMWKADRVRRFQPVTPVDLDCSLCMIFPNMYNGLNQRKLEVLTKQDLGDIVTVNAAKDRYEGYLIDVLPDMAEMLNFTYTLSPEPRYDMNMNWVDHFNAVADGKVDLGLSMWTEQPLSDKLVEVSSAIIHDISTGVYKRPPLPRSLYVMFPFPLPVYLILVLSLIFATSLYIFIDVVSSRALPKNEAKDKDTTSGHHNLQANESIDSISNNRFQTGQGTTTKQRSMEAVCRYLNLLAVFAVAIMNHSYFPLPQSMSARFVIWYWCMTLVMFYALYTSSMTADIVVWKQELPFTTYDKLVDQGDYRWATFALTYDQTYFSAITGAPFDKLNKHMEVSDYNMEAIDNMLNNKYVILYGERFMKLVLSKSSYFSDLVFMKNKLIPASFGLILPYGSELRDVISSTIDKMHQSGMINRHIEKRTFHFNIKGKGEQREKAVVLRDMSNPFLVILCFLLITLVCLWIERMIAWLMVKRTDFQGIKKVFKRKVMMT